MLIRDLDDPNPHPQDGNYYELFFRAPNALEPSECWAPSLHTCIHDPLTKGTLLGTPNREPQEYSRNIMEHKDPGRYIPIIYLLYS